MRKKIEMSTERIRVAKLKEEQARKEWEAALKAVKDEEAIKQKLCEDLNNLVQESSNSQFARLEELKRRLEALNPSRSSSSASYDAKPMGPAQNSLAVDTSLVHTVVTAGTEGIANRGNGGNTPVMNGHDHPLSAEGEGRGKKKNPIQGRGRGIGAVPKGSRGNAGPGWTGAGFDVDGRS
ncbi:aci13 [Sarracenia purpurea var. burkii]